MRCKITCLLVCLLMLSVSHAQSLISITDKKANSRIAELRSKKVNLLVCYYVNCVGYVKIYHPDSCNTALVKYLLWKAGTKAYLQRFDNCVDYKPNQIPPDLVNTIIKNLNTIKNASLYVGVVDGKKTILTVMRDHSCHYMFEIHTPTGTIIKDIDDFALDTKELDDYSGNIKDEPRKRHNDNYEKNQLSILVKLKNMAEQITDVLNKKGPVNGAF
jgi:hypothetical protein